MMPRLVLVHGAGGVQRADDSRRVWIDALTEGAAAARFFSTPSLLAVAKLDVIFAYYGDLLYSPGAQGNGAPPSEDDVALVVALLDAMVEQQLTIVTDQHTRLVLAGVREQLRPSGTAQGGSDLLRIATVAAATLVELRSLRHAGQPASGKDLVRDLTQVARYLNRGEFDGKPTLHQRICRRVLDGLGSGPAIVVAHELGAVVAFEALREFVGDVPLFVTLGVSAEIWTVAVPRLRPAPPAAPESVGRWLNFGDHDTDVARGRRPERLFLPNSRAVLPASTMINSGTGGNPVARYLANPTVAGPIMEAVHTLGQR